MPKINLPFSYVMIIKKLKVLQVMKAKKNNEAIGCAPLEEVCEKPRLMVQGMAQAENIDGQRFFSCYLKMEIGQNLQSEQKIDVQFKMIINDSRVSCHSHSYTNDDPASGDIICLSSEAVNPDFYNKEELTIKYSGVITFEIGDFGIANVREIKLPKYVKLGKLNYLGANPENVIQKYIEAVNTKKKNWIVYYQKVIYHFLIFDLLEEHAFDDMPENACLELVRSFPNSF